LQSGLCVKMSEFGKIIRPKKEITKALNEAKSQVFYGLYLSLGTNERDKSIYSLAKGHERKTIDFD